MESLIAKHNRLLDLTKTNFTRSLMSDIDWNLRLIAIRGARGVGKTTMLLQYIKKQYGKNASIALYISLDSIYFLNHTLSECVNEFYQKGGKHLFIDEVHKYPNWSREIKNIYDEYPDLKIVFTGSSLINILNAEADLSRRCISYTMQGLSYREYLELFKSQTLPRYTLNEILNNPTNAIDAITAQIKPLQWFEDYLQNGYYPFKSESGDYYHIRVENTVNMILDIELPQQCNVEIGNIRKIKTLLATLASEVPMLVDISKLSAISGISRTTLLSYLQYLERAKLIKLLYSDDTSIKKMQKPDKILIENSNLLYSLSIQGVNPGTMREVFFCNQVGYQHNIEYSKNGDFFIDRIYSVEVGGKSKDGKQIANIENAFIAADNIDYSYGNKLPLWLFGFLY